MFKNKKNLFIILLALVLTGVGIYFIKFAHPIRKLTQAQKDEVQKTLSSNFKAQKGYSVSLKIPRGTNQTAELTGTLTPTGDFQGKYELPQTTQNQQPASKEVFNLIKVGADIYVQEAKESTYSKINNMFAYELNIMAHPEDIQVQNQLRDKKIKGIIYSQYQIIFEKPGQEIVKNMSQELLAVLRISGTILMDKNTSQLKQMTVHRGKDTKSQTIIEYSPENTTPIIKPPI